MTYSLGASGPVDQAKETLALQARQYEDKAAEHVKNFLHALLGEVESDLHVSVSASGSHDQAGYHGTFNITPITPAGGSSASGSGS